MNWTDRYGNEVGAGEMNRRLEAMGAFPADLGDTVVTWTYRDGANYKVTRAASFSGPPTAELVERLALATHWEDGRPYFITAEVDLGEHVLAEKWDNDIDQPFSIITGISATDRDMDPEQVRQDGRSFTEFVQNMEEASTDEGWTPEGWLPPNDEVSLRL